MSFIPQLQKEFIETLEGFGHSRHKQTVFSDCLEMAAIALHQIPYHTGDFPKDETFAALEEKYAKVEERYIPDERVLIANLLGITMTAHSQGFNDFLGDIASDQALLNKKAGQFFTPYEVCRMMAQMTLSDARSVVEEKGLITIQEPVSGGGALVIACAEELARQKIDPRSCAHFHCIDISRDAFNMTYIQLSALDLQAIVHHGDTLSPDLKMWESRPTPQHRYFDRWLQQHRDAARLKRVRDLIVDPASFFAAQDAGADTALPPAAEEAAADSRAPAPQRREAQASLFDMNAAAPPPSKESRRPRRKADVVLPRDRQLDLFSDDDRAA